MRLRNRARPIMRKHTSRNLNSTEYQWDETTCGWWERKITHVRLIRDADVFYQRQRAASRWPGRTILCWEWWVSIAGHSSFPVHSCQRGDTCRLMSDQMDGPRSSWKREELHFILTNRRCQRRIIKTTKQTKFSCLAPLGLSFIEHLTLFRLFYFLHVALHCQRGHQFHQHISMRQMQKKTADERRRVRIPGIFD